MVYKARFMNEYSVIRLEYFEVILLEGFLK